MSHNNLTSSTFCAETEPAYFTSEEGQMSLRDLRGVKDYMASLRVYLS